MEIKKIISKILLFLNNNLFDLCITCSVAFLPVLFAPLELFFNNQGEFWFNLSLLLPVLLLAYLGTIIVIFAIMFFLKKINYKLYWFFISFLTIFFVGSYIQGNFLISNLPPLDGTNISWNEYSGERIKSIIVWFLVICVVFICFKKTPLNIYRKIVFLIHTVFLGVLCVTIVFTGIISYTSAPPQSLTWTDKNLLTVSSNNNFIVLLLDAVDANVCSEIMQENEKYMSAFKDFTFYSNTLGAYPFTKHSIPMILTGEWYENNGSFYEYVSNSLQNSLFFKELKKQDYTLDIYTESLSLKADGNENNFDNGVLEENTYSSAYNFLLSAIKMGGIKFFPFDLKRFCYGSIQEIQRTRKIHQDVDFSPFSNNNQYFFYLLNTMPLNLNAENMYKFIHIEGAHVPFRYDENVNIIENGTYKDNVKASLTIAQKYLETLIEKEVYDNSVIIIMADHGYDESNGPYGRQNPILFIKGFNEKHEQLQISEVPVSFDDLQSAYVKLLHGQKGDELFIDNEKEERQRRYLFYVYEQDDHMLEYIQTGAASNLSTLIPTGKEFNITSESAKEYPEKPSFIEVSQKSFQKIVYNDITFRIDNLLETVDKNIEINGWTLSEELNNNTLNYYIEVSSETSDPRYFKMDKYMREDISNAFGDQYLFSGFYGQIDGAFITTDHEYILRIGIEKDNILYLSKENYQFSQNDTSILDMKWLEH